MGAEGERTRRELLYRWSAVATSLAGVALLAMRFASVRPLGPATVQAAVWLLVLAPALLDAGRQTERTRIHVLRPQWGALFRGVSLVPVGIATGLAALLAAAWSLLPGLVALGALLVIIRATRAVRVSSIGIHRFGGIDAWSDVAHALPTASGVKYLCPDGNQRVWRHLRAHPDLRPLVETWLAASHPFRRALEARAGA